MIPCRALQQPIAHTEHCSSRHILNFPIVTLNTLVPPLNFNIPLLSPSDFSNAQLHDLTSHTTISFIISNFGFSCISFIHLSRIIYLSLPPPTAPWSYHYNILMSCHPNSYTHLILLIQLSLPHPLPVMSPSSTVCLYTLLSVYTLSLYQSCTPLTAPDFHPTGEHLISITNDASGCPPQSTYEKPTA